MGSKGSLKSVEDGPAGTAHLTISRDSERDIKMRGLEVYVDDELVGNLSYGNNLSIDLPSGEHAIKVTNRLYTQTLKLKLEPSEEVNVKAGNVMTGLGGILISVFGVGPYKVFVAESDRHPLG